MILGPFSSAGGMPNMPVRQHVFSAFTAGSALGGEALRFQS